MSKQKPLPPRRSEGTTKAPLAIQPVAPPKEPSPAQSENPVLRGNWLALKPGTEITSLRYESHAIHCPASEDRFNDLAAEMLKGGWELVAVVTHQRYVSMGSNHGMSNGWMTFWKRLAQPQVEEKKINESA